MIDSGVRPAQGVVNGILLRVAVFAFEAGEGCAMCIFYTN
jgi:hypothetical protein